MANWLFKEEPETYSFADLQRDGSTTWSGVANPQAQKNLRAIKKGDRVFFYATGKVKAVVGVMLVTADPVPDPADTTGKRVAVVGSVLNDVPLGNGQLDWPEILQAAAETGVKHYFIEDEAATAPEQIPESRKYLSEVKW